MGDRPTVLFVDDEQSLADGRAAQLSDDYETRTAYDGRSALETLDDAVDVVFLDRRMPGQSGEAVLESIRERGYDCRVVMLTGVEPDAEVVEMGYDEYLVKPVDIEDLRDAVERAEARSEAGGEMDSAVLDALSDPKTRHCCRVLADGRYSASDLAKETGYSLTTVYRRLNSLRQADLVSASIAIDPDGDHHETYALVPTRIEIAVRDDGDVVLDRSEKKTA